MSTSGLYGIRKNGVDKCTYNHCDSYPNWLGKGIATFCANNSIEDLERFFDNIVLVDENSEPTNEQIDDCKAAGYVNLDVSEQSIDDWYCLLRELQGNFEAYQKCIDDDSKVYMTDGINFIRDSVFCEYAYIINLDDKVLEFYIGVQREPQDGNRYGVEKVQGYYPCKLCLTFPLDEFPDVEFVVNMMKDEDGNRHE